ncbi:hypothetical protein AL713_15860 [Clostridium botulinum]|nr:hypothetical protein AL713_15860 [Clostridium botulinum]
MAYLLLDFGINTEVDLFLGSVGNVNAMKMAKCIKELERIYGIYHGGDRKSNQNNLGLKTQQDLANQIGIDQRQLQNYKKLNELIPELQSLVETGDLKSTNKRNSNRIRCV